MSGVDNIWMARIGGIGSFTTGEPYLYTTRPCTRSGYVVVPSLVREIGISPSTMQLLEPVALNRTANIELSNRSESGLFPVGIEALLRRDAAPVRTTAGSVVRLAAYASAATTSFTVSDSAPFTLNRWYSLASEVVKVTAKPDGTTLTVLRAQMGSRAEPHHIAGIGPVFLDRPVDVVGRRVIVEVASWDGTTLGTPRVVFTGIARSPSETGTRIRIEMEGPLNPMMQRKWLPPQCYRAENGDGLGATLSLRFYTEAGFDIGSGPCTGVRTSRWAMSRLIHGELALDYIRYVHEDGRWVVVACSAVADADAEASGFDPLTDEVYESGTSAPARIVAAGEGMEPIALSRFDEPGTWLSWTGGSEWPNTKAEYLDVFTEPVYVGDYVETLLADATRPLGVGIGSDQVATSLAETLNDAMPYPLAMPQAASGYWMSPRFDPGTPFRDVLRAYVEPLHCSLVSGRDGQVRVVDPVTLTVAEQTFTDDIDIRGAGLPSHRFGRETVLRSLIYTTKIGTDTTNTQVFSDVAQSLYAGGRDVEIETVIYGMLHDALRQRAVSLLRMFERSRPEVPGITTDDTDANGDLRTVDVGGVVALDHAKVIGLDGQRGTAAGLRALVLECARQNTQLTWRFVLLDATQGFLWSPGATVASKAAGVITVNAADFSTGDAGKFAVGDQVILLDEFRDVKVATPTAVTAVSGNTVSVSAASSVYTSAAALDRLVLATWDDTTTPRDWGWWADTNGTLPTGADPGYIWA